MIPQGKQGVPLLYARDEVGRGEAELHRGEIDWNEIEVEACIFQQDR